MTYTSVDNSILDAAALVALGTHLVNLTHALGTADGLSAISRTNGAGVAFVGQRLQAFGGHPLDIRVGAGHQLDGPDVLDGGQRGELLCLFVGGVDVV